MNGPVLRAVHDDELPAPRVDDLSAHVVAEATDTLAALSTTYWLGDSAVHLHALASLIAQAQQLPPAAVHAARDQEFTWTQIGQRLNLASSTTIQEQPMINLTRINHIMPKRVRSL